MGALFEETGAEATESLDLILRIDEDGDVVRRAAVGDHANGHIGERLEYCRGIAFLIGGKVTGDADDALVLINLDGAKLLEVVDDVIEVTVGIDGHGDTHFGCCYHIDGCLVALEDLEHLAHKAVGEEHAAALDAEGDDVVLGSNGSDTVGALMPADEGAMGFGIHGVEKADGYVVDLGGQDTCGVEYLSAEISKFGSLVEGEFGHGFGVVNESGVIVVHAIDVCPYLDLVSKERSTNERGGIVRATTLEVVDLAEGVAADVALGDIDVEALVLLHEGVEVLTDIGSIGLVVLIDAHIVEGGEQA